MPQLVKNPPAMQRPGFDPWVGKIPWRRERLPTPVFWPGEFHGLYHQWGRKESDMTSDFHFTLVFTEVQALYGGFTTLAEINTLTTL